MTEIHPVLLAGGTGTRLWPLSRASYPKQFVPLVGEETLFQAAARRLSGAGFAPPVAVTGAAFRFIVSDQLAALGIAPGAILIEPAQRNSAPAVCAAALAVQAKAPGALMLVAPCDHAIPDAESLRATVLAAVPAALAGRIVTFGIRPDRAETGYGWLAPEAMAGTPPWPLAAFVEKPDLIAAEAMLAGGAHLWNAGIFLAATHTMLAAFAAHAPQILAAARVAFGAAEHDLGFTRLAPGPWAGAERISLDHAVMEKAGNLSVMPYDGAWSDLGDWEAVWRAGTHDAAGVVTHGPATAIGCEDVLLHAEPEGPHLVGLGLAGLVAVALPDAVLVAPKARAQEVGRAVAALREEGVPQTDRSRRDHRPWGWAERLASGPRFQVKRLVVHPGGRLSLQSHRHRAEHWVVVAGTARVTTGDEVRLVTENQSVYIPPGCLHRLENPGRLALTLIEVQTGSYLGEDDILRHDDAYAREAEP